MSAIEAQSICKSYNSGKVPALIDVSLSVERGEIFGLIGPDGAGKTSLFRIFTTVLLADSGSASVDGCDVVKDFRLIRSRVGYMPGRFSLYQDLSVEENLNFFARVFHTTIEQNYDLVRDIYVQLEPFKTRRAGKLSGGMKQKLALCCALIHKPVVLFLDEPTTGVDPVSRREFWEMLARLREQGITILVSTPYMDEAARCNRIAFINRARILAIDTPKNITSLLSKSLFGVRSRDSYRTLVELRAAPFTAHCYGYGDSHHLALNDDSITAAEVSEYLHRKGISDVLIYKLEAGIEDTFIDIAGMQSSNG